MAIKGRRHILSVREQLAWVRLRWPDMRSAVHGKTLVVTGDYQPSPLSETYRVRTLYEFGSPVDVRVLSPELRRRTPDEKIPHMYLQERLCLFLPWADQWAGDKILADTIIPWTSLWLHYYELWLATGEWLGGGHQPEEPKNPIHKERPDGYDHPAH
jgi:hypothetical protein